MVTGMDTPRHTKGHRLGKSGQRIPRFLIKKVDLGSFVYRGKSVVDIIWDGILLCAYILSILCIVSIVSIPVNSVR